MKRYLISIMLLLVFALPSFSDEMLHVNQTPMKYFSGVNNTYARPKYPPLSASDVSMREECEEDGCADTLDRTKMPMNMNGMMQNYDSSNSMFMMQHMQNAMPGMVPVY